MSTEHMLRGQLWLTSLLQLASLPSTAEAEPIEAHEDGSCWLTIGASALTPEQISALLGTQGEVLDSIQYLINTTLNMGRAEDQQQPYTIELASYRARRQVELKNMAEQAAQQVRQTGEEFEMTALSSAERRQVHTFLKPYEDLETSSRGQEPDRRLVVRRK